MRIQRCETCGNEYDKAFEVVTFDGARHIFDSFECAISKLAPECQHCGCRVIGHGMEAGGRIFCCASGAQAVGASADLTDRA